MSEYAVMPYAHYSAACAATRAKTGKTANITSGQLADEIASIEGGGGAEPYTVPASPTVHIWDNGTPFCVGDTIVYKTSSDRANLYMSAQEEVMDLMSTGLHGVLMFWVARNDTTGTYSTYTISTSGAKFSNAATGTINNSSTATGKLRVGYYLSTHRTAVGQAASAYAYCTGAAITPVFVAFDDMCNGNYASTAALTIGTQQSYTNGYAKTNGMCALPWHLAIWYGGSGDLTKTSDNGTTNAKEGELELPEFTGASYANSGSTFTVPRVTMRLYYVENSATTRQLGVTYTGNSDYPDDTNFNSAIFMSSYSW